MIKKFFARHLKKYNHPKHNYVSKLKHRIPKLKWSTTKNHSDCGVFTMMHLEHYFGKPVGQWDFGLCEELDEQVLMLRRMRFKIAAKILLNEFNIYSEKMFDLALKFETENDEQKRISIIVNAIKNRNERDPAKKK
ncbi:ulp1 protease family, C-terminal catalytic domain-containing protein [Tanacetum coccineum]